MTRYTVTYSFDGYPHAQYRDPVSLITETVAEMQQNGTDIAFLGATQEFDPSGRVTRTTARYSASNKGAIGLLNCRARLPACGSPQRRSVVERDSEDSRGAVTG
jgi:hypothetical protein